jgi:hypothetical protein
MTFIRTFTWRKEKSEKLVMEAVSAYQLEWDVLRKQLVKWFNRDFPQKLVG